MKKLCGLTVFTILFFTVKSFAGNHPANPSGNKVAGKSFAPAVDSTQKAVDTDSADDGEDDDVRSYAIGLEFGSDQSSHGIRASKPLPYIQPSFTYTAKSGFYIEASDQFILSKDSGGFDAFALNPGWNIDFTDNFTLNFNLTHYWFRPNTPLTIKSDLSDVIETYADQSIGKTEGKFTIDYDYYKKTSAVTTPGDIIFTPDLSHTFKIKISKKSSVSLIPEGSFDFGTTNAYTHYLAKSSDTLVSGPVKRRKIRNGESAFAALDYSLAFTVNYKVGDFEFEPAINFMDPIYKVPGVPSKPIGFVTIDLIYTIY